MKLVKENEEESDNEEETDDLGGFEKVRYDAPELKLGIYKLFEFLFYFIKGEEGTIESDVFSFGLIMYSLVVRDIPFPELDSFSASSFYSIIFIY
jgi:serine/threonine protein kinase